MSVNNSTGKKTYAQVAAASPPQSEHGNGSEAGESQSPTNPNIVDLSNSGTKSGSTDSSIGSEPELINASLDSSKSADDGKPTDGQNSKTPEDKAAEEFIPRKRTSMLTDKGSGRDGQSQDGGLEVLSEEMEKKRARRRKAVAIIGGVFVGLAVVGAIWWAVRRRSNGG